MLHFVSFPEFSIFMVGPSIGPSTEVCWGANANLPCKAELGWPVVNLQCFAPRSRAASVPLTHVKLADTEKYSCDVQKDDQQEKSGVKGVFAIRDAMSAV